MKVFKEVEMTEAEAGLETVITIKRIIVPPNENEKEEVTHMFFRMEGDPEGYHFFIQTYKGKPTKQQIAALYNNVPLLILGRVNKNLLP